jgi:hydroxyethylthiazole kinase-like uncharacterized protein yjeF
VSRAVYRSADVRAAEQAYMATLPPGTLMQRAAAGLARRCADLLIDGAGGVYGRTVVVLAGAGDNGGDALYAGARLARRGARVLIVRANPEKIHASGLAAARAAGARVVDTPAGRADLVIEGLVGIGAEPPLRGRAAELVGALADRPDRPVVVAVDVPAGVAVDTGDVPAGPVLAADVTVTFGCLKPALVVGPAAPLAGAVDLVDIGLGPWLRAEPAVRVPDLADIASWWPAPHAGSDKYTRGVVGLAVGSAGYPGAAVLSASGALAGPTGLVRYAGGAASAVSAAHPEVIVTDKAGSAGRVQAWVCGSGLGTDDRAQTELRAVLSAPVPVCLDADAITMLVDGSMAPELRNRNAPTVITPHDREFARLASATPGIDRVAAALQLASWVRATVLLKGDRTIVASPSGQVWVNPTGSPALATAGTGDVLAGLIGALLAAGLGPDQAAIAGAYLHGLAGRSAAREGQPSAATIAAALREVTGSLAE